MKKHIFLSLFIIVASSQVEAQFLSWTNKANLPQAPLASGARSVGVATMNGRLYTVGGLSWPNPVASVLEYDPGTDTWAQKANMLSPRYAPAAASVNGKLYAIGGSVNSSTTLTGSMEEYDPGSNTWTNRASMNQVRYAFQAVAVNGKIYAMGGQGPGDVPLASVEEYDPVMDTWTPRSDMPIPRVSFGAVAFNGLIYVVSGRIVNNFRSEVYVFNPALNLWSTNASIPTARETLGVAVVNQQIWAFGGSSPGQARSTIEAYDPVNDVWTKKQSLPAPRNECFGTVFGDMLYVFGGYDNWSMQAARVSPVLNLHTAIELDFLTEAGKSYQLQASPDMSTWTNFGPEILGDGNYWSSLYSTKGSGKLFFRFSQSP
jgi:N-acetylneuraminic acid mutarotase